MMKSRLWRSVTAVCLMAVISAAGGAEAQDEFRGKQLSKTWCVSCHIVEPGGAGADAAPPFAAIANDENYTHDRLQTWLADPHPPMPKLDLSRGEINAIVRYIESLRTN